MKKIDYQKGIHFECQGSSNCCVSRGTYGFVYLSKKDLIRLSRFTKLKISDFIKLYCDKTNGFTHLKEKNKNGNCLFLEKKNVLSIKLGLLNVVHGLFGLKTWNLKYGIMIFQNFVQELEGEN